MKVDPPLELEVVFPRTTGVPMHNLASAIDEQAHQRDDVLLILEAFTDAG